MCVLYCSDQREWVGCDYRCVYCIVAISGSGRIVTIDVCMYCSDQREWAGCDYRCVYCIVAISGSG